jgi:hypothetical protein
MTLVCRPGATVFSVVGSTVPRYRSRLALLTSSCEVFPPPLVYRLDSDHTMPTNELSCRLLALRY